jgi:hypothetical protein
VAVIGALLGVMFRSLAAVVFVLTAYWKLSNPIEFEASFVRLAPPALRTSSRWLLVAVAASELLLAGALLAGIRVAALSLAAPVAAAALVLVFTVVLTVGEEGGCGCWTTPQAGSRWTLKLAPIARNVVLLCALVGAAVCSPSGAPSVDLPAGLAPFVAGAVLAVLLVEFPQIAAAVTLRSHPADRAV